MGLKASLLADSFTQGQKAPPEVEPGPLTSPDVVPGRLGCPGQAASPLHARTCPRLLCRAV